MTERALRPANVAAAAVTIGGVLVVAAPQHAVSIAQLVLVTVAAAAGVYSLAVNVPATGWISPFKWMSPFHGSARPGRDGRGSGEVDAIRSKLSGRRQPIENGPPLSPDTLRLLKPVITAALDIDPTDEAQLISARDVLSPLAWAVLTGDPLTEPYWLRTVGPDEREVAEVVHAVLDEIDRLAAPTLRVHGRPAAKPPIAILHPRDP